VAELKLGKRLPKVAIPFCLQFAPRDINLVRLQQYLQSVQGVLEAVMPRRTAESEESKSVAGGDTNQEVGTEEGNGCSHTFVFDAVQLNLRDFELNESVARALKEVLDTGAKVSCLHLPLKATDFLAEDECPRQPLADCLLSVTGGGARAQLFSSTFGPEPQREESENACSTLVEAVVVNDVDIDDRRFAALCSALRGATGLKSVVLDAVFAQDSRYARLLKWKWLAYALFAPNGARSSVTRLVINEPQLLADDVQAIASVVTACKPSRELLDPLWAEHEASQRVFAEARENGEKREPEWSSTHGDDMVRLKQGTVLYLEPLCSHDEWLQSSVVLERDADFAVMNSEGSESSKRDDEDALVEVLVPGYGKCWVHPDVAQDRYAWEAHSGAWSGITDLSLAVQVPKSSTDKVLVQLFQNVGHELVSVELQTNVLREQGLDSILRSCPRLRSLSLDGAQVEDMFAFTHGYDVGYCQLESLSIEHFRVSPASLDEFAKVLGDPSREAARQLRRLSVGRLRIQDIDVAAADYENMIESFARMLSTNATLERLSLCLEGDFYTRLAKSLTLHDGEKLSPMELPLTCKLAFVSSFHSGGRQRLEDRLVWRIFGFAARLVTRAVCVTS